MLDSSGATRKIILPATDFVRTHAHSDSERDEDLLCRIRGGCEDSFAFGIPIEILREVPEAEEIMQEVLVGSWP